MSEQCYFIATGRHGIVLWHGHAASVAAASRTARTFAEPGETIEVTVVADRPKGPRGIRVALCIGTLADKFTAGEDDVRQLRTAVG